MELLQLLVKTKPIQIPYIPISNATKNNIKMITFTRTSERP